MRTAILFSAILIADSNNWKPTKGQLLIVGIFVLIGSVVDIIELIYFFKNH